LVGKGDKGGTLLEAPGVKGARDMEERSLLGKKRGELEGEVVWIASLTLT
jgi:hypothetical protein